MQKGIMVSSCLAVALLIGGRMIASPAADADKGKGVFEDNCAVCHNSDSTEKKMGPGLKGLFKHEKLNNGKKPTEANIKVIINEGGNGMPSFSDTLTDDERANVLAYLKTL